MEHGLDFITDGEDLREFDVALEAELATGDDRRTLYDQQRQNSSTSKQVR
jgi:hypothetical protein